MPSVDSSIDWGASYSCGWRVLAIDPATWQPTGTVDGVVSASCTRDASGILLESGSLEADGEVGDREMWVRVELTARQVGAERAPVLTMLAIPAPSEVRRGRSTARYDLHSVLKPAADVHLLAGAHVPAGADAAAAAVELIAQCTPAPVSADGEFRLSEPYVFARGTTNLEAASMLVGAAGWCIQVETDGSVHVRRMPTDPALVIGRGSGLLGPSVEPDDGNMGAPNRYVAVEGGATAIAEDSDPDSPTSTVVRGRVVEVYDDAPTRVGGESLDEYARRRLAELTETVGRRSYTRAWVPGITLNDVIVGEMPEADLDCRMRVVHQVLNLGAEMTVSEECEVLK